MKAILKGIERKNGTLDSGKEYDNYYLHCVQAREVNGVKGIAVEKIKVAPSIYDDFMKGKTDDMVLDKKIDIDVAVVNNKGVVQSVELVK